ncbi:MAG: hypothetical protein FWG69_05520, partial [Oscillospiraceae bacterium]|nr:hypothetical protein [Oscillospiraceae bacterium]
MFRVIRIHKYTICISIPCIILFVFIFGVLAVRGAAKYGSSHYMRQNEIQEIKEMQEMQVPVLMYHSLQKNTKK